MDFPDASSSPPSIEADLAAMRGLLRQDKFADAMAAGQALIARAPAQRDALLMMALAQRFCGRVGDAFNTLTTLERHYPRFSRLHEERGHCFVFMKQAQPAIDAFSAAVSLNHALPNSWAMLEGLYRMTGQAEAGQMASAQVSTLKRLPSEVVTATGLLADGDLDQSERLIRAYLLKHGNDIEAMRLLARIGVARKVFDDPEILLAAVLELAPDYHAARAEYAEVLIEFTNTVKRARNWSGCCAMTRRTAPMCRASTRPLLSGSASTSAPSACTGSCSRTRRRMRTCTCRWRTP